MEISKRTLKVSICIVLLTALTISVCVFVSPWDFSVNAESTKLLRMDARETVGVYGDDTYQLGTGITVSAKSDWSANSGLADSEGNRRTLYTGSAGKWIQYHPNQSGMTLEYGYYDVYFWFPYHEQNAGINLNAEISSKGKIRQISCSALAANAGNSTESRWVKIGSFDFTGASDEYLKLTSTGFARIADVKFVKAGVRMDARTTEGFIYGSDIFDYELGEGVSLSDQNDWGGNSTLADSQGDLKTIYSTNFEASIQYCPNLVQDGLEAGTYDVYFWYPFYRDEILLNVDVNANGTITHVPEAVLEENAGQGSEARWVKVGTFDFTGSDSEYLKLNAIGLSVHVSDVKFIKTDLHMDTRSTVGQLFGSDSYTYDLSNGVSISSKNDWSANSSLRNSQQLVRTLYTGSSGRWVQFSPNQIGSALEPAFYDVYFWFVYNNQNSGINLDAEIKANGQVYQIPCSDLVTSAGEGTDSRWVKIGNYEFAGNSDEYLKLTSTGFARIADVKFVKTASALPSVSPSPLPSADPVFNLNPDVTFDDGNAAVFTLSIPEGTTESFHQGTSTTGGSSHTYCDLGTAKGIFTMSGVADGKYEVYYKIPLVHSSNTDRMTLSFTDSIGMTYSRTYDIRTQGTDQSNPADNVSAQGYHTQQWIKLEGTYSFYSGKTAALTAGKESGAAGSVRYDCVGLVRVGDVPPIMDFSPATVQSSCNAGQIYDFAVMTKNQQPQNSVKYTVTYNASELEIYDIFGYTPEQELTAEALSERGIALITNSPGRLVFQCSDTAAEGQTLSGVVNLLRFKAVSDGEKSITVQANRELPV